MLPPMKEYLTITYEEFFSLLQSKSNDDLNTLTPEIINETMQPFICYGCDLPEEIQLEQNIEKEFETLHGKPLTNIKKFLEYMEKLNVIFKQYSPCKKGCSKCCFIPVLVSSLEVSLIDEYLITNGYNSKYRRKEKTINDLLSKDNNKYFGEEFNGMKCPFLKKNECIIYDVRPYVCRKHITFENNNEKCGYKAAKISLFTSVTTEKTYENIIKYYLIKNTISTSNDVIFGDIREYFCEE